MLPDPRSAREVLAETGVDLDALPPVDEDVVSRPGRQGHNQGIEPVYRTGAIHQAVELLRQAAADLSARRVA